MVLAWALSIEPPSRLRHHRRGALCTGAVGEGYCVSVTMSLQTEFRPRLEARRAELTRSIEEGRRADQPVSPDKAIGRLTRQDAIQQIGRAHV